MTRRDRGWVIQCMRDLLAVKIGQQREPQTTPPGEVPAGVAARLALVWTGSQDAAVLTGGVKRGTRDDQAGRRALLERAVAEYCSLDLQGPIELPVLCGKAVHRVRLEADGTLAAVTHPSLDIGLERVAVSLGGELLPCLQAIDDAHRSWPPPVAEDGRLEPIGVGELLAFVGTCRSWLDRGYDLPTAGTALDQGVGYDDVAEHLAVGLALPTAIEWSRVAPGDAVRWVALGFAFSDAQVWLEQRRTLEQLEAAAGEGDARWLARWARITGAQVSVEALAEWASFGMPVGVWGEAASRGLRASEVPVWLAAGFEAVEVLRYAHLRVSVAEAVAWRAAGFTAYAATGCLGVGMTLDDACAVRGLPTKAVQNAWRQCGSVAAVLEALAS